jgi:hypothetical protein
MNTNLSPAVTALWRTAGTRVAAAGLPADMRNRDAMVTVAGAFTAAEVQALAAGEPMWRFLPAELHRTAETRTATTALTSVELQSVEMVVARNWRVIAVEVGRLRRPELAVTA